MKKRGVLRGKKAMSSILLSEAMQLLMTGLMLTSSLGYVQDKLDKPGFYKAFYSRDFGIMMTALYGVPGNVYQIYSTIPKGEEDNLDLQFHFDVSEGIVRINMSDSPKHRLYWYFSDPKIRFNSYNENLGVSHNVQIGKEGDYIKLGEKISVNKKAISCAYIDTKQSDWLKKTFIFDAAHGENVTDLGAVNQKDSSFYESNIALKIILSSELSRIGNLKRTRESESYVKIEERQKIISDVESNAMIVSFHVGDYEDGSNHIRAYYNADSTGDIRLKSKRLGCELLNSIMYSFYEKSNEFKMDFNVKGVVVIPSDSEYIKKMVPAGKIGILLDLGNVQLTKKDHFLTDTTRIAKAVYSGLENYHEK